MKIRAFQEAIQVPWKRTLYIIFFAEMMTSVGFSSIFPFLPNYVTKLGSDYGFNLVVLAALVYSGQAFTMMLASPIWGMLSDRIGRKPMVMRAMIGATIILAMMAFVENAEQLVILRAIQGLVTGTISAANALVAGETPRERIGYAMGLLQVGQAGGVALGPVIGGILADQIGYGGVFFFTAGLIFLAAVLVWFGVQEHFVPPQEDGKKRAGVMGRWKSLLQAPGVIMIYVLRFTTRLGHLMILPMIPLFIVVLMPNISNLNTVTGLVIGAAFITNAIASVYLGKLGDQIGHRKILIVSCIAAGMIFLVQSLVVTGWELIALQALFGITLGGMVPSLSALLAKYSSVGQEGVAYGLDNSIVSGARTVAPLLGASVALIFSLRATFVFTALTFFIAAFLSARFLRAGQTVKEPTNLS